MAKFFSLRLMLCLQCINVVASESSPLFDSAVDQARSDDRLFRRSLSSIQIGSDEGSPIILDARVVAMALVDDSTGYAENSSPSPISLVERPSFFMVHGNNSLPTSPRRSLRSSPIEEDCAERDAMQFKRRALSREFAGLSNKLFSLSITDEVSLVEVAILAGQIQRFRDLYAHQRLCSDEGDQNTGRSCDELLARIPALYQQARLPIH